MQLAFRRSLTADDKSASEAAVKIDNFSFSPATITVPVGTTVRWTNRDDIPHTVVSDDKTFKSKCSIPTSSSPTPLPSLAPIATSARIHPKMTAKVVVQ